MSVLRNKILITDDDLFDISAQFILERTEFAWRQGFPVKVTCIQRFRGDEVLQDKQTGAPDQFAHGLNIYRREEIFDESRSKFVIDGGAHDGPDTVFDLVFIDVTRQTRS